MSPLTDECITPMHARIIELHKSVIMLGETEIYEDDQSPETLALFARYQKGQAELSELRNQMAIKFAQQSGLNRLGIVPFKLPLDHLRRTEHAELWRDATGQAVIVCHLFDYKPRLLTIDRDSLQSFAVKRGWTVSFPDCISWWHPGWASLIAYTIPPERLPIKVLPSLRGGRGQLCAKNPRPEPKPRPSLMPS